MPRGDGDDDEEESALLSSIGTGVAFTDAYETSVLRDAELGDDVPNLPWGGIGGGGCPASASCGLPDLSALGTSHASSSSAAGSRRGRAGKGSAPSSSADLPHVLTALSRTRSEIRRLSGTSDELSDSEESESRRFLVLRAKEQMLLIYLRDVCRISREDYGTYVGDAGREIKGERERSTALRGGGGSRKRPAAAEGGTGGRGKPTPVGEPGRKAMKRSRSERGGKIAAPPGSLSASERLDRIKKGVIVEEEEEKEEDDCASESVGNGPTETETAERSRMVGMVRVTSSSATASFGKQALIERSQRRLLSKRKSVMAMKRAMMEESGWDKRAQDRASDPGLQSDLLRRREERRETRRLRRKSRRDGATGETTAEATTSERRREGGSGAGKDGEDDGDASEFELDDIDGKDGSSGAPSGGSTPDGGGDVTPPPPPLR